MGAADSRSRVPRGPEQTPGPTSKSTRVTAEMPSPGATQEYVPDLSHVTGRTAAARNEAIRSVIAEDLPDLKLTFPPRYNPFIRTGIAAPGEGSQIGKNRFSSRLQLTEAIVHEELHQRWWSRGLTNNHPATADQIKPSDFFHYTVDRYLQFRGMKTGDGPGPHKRIMEKDG